MRIRHLNRVRRSCSSLLRRVDLQRSECILSSYYHPKVFDTSLGSDRIASKYTTDWMTIQEHDRNAGFDDIMFRKKIYLGVVKPLEDELQATSGLSVEDLDNLRSTDHLFRRIIDSQRRYASISSSPVVTLPPKISVRPPQLFGKSSTGTHEQEPVKVCLYDEHYTTGIATLQE
jgi:hypothetical protein